MVPHHLIGEVLKTCHEEEGGNLGYTKTMAWIDGNFYFDGMMKIMYKNVQGCP